MMSSGQRERITWHDALTRRFSGQRNGRSAVALTEDAVRNSLVARVRWILLLFIGGYILSAGSVFLFSRYGFFLTTEQKAVLLLSVLSVIFYNSLYQFFYEKLRSFRYANHIQILLDILFVTAIVHVSGGVSSWFWAVYLVVTIEAAFLLEQKKDVWFVGAFGAILYGALLTLDYNGVVRHVQMPFVVAGLHNNFLYLALRWLWVTILNGMSAVVTTFLMGVIRTESRLLKESEERLFNFIDTANDLIFSTTPEGKFIYANRACHLVLACASDELNAKTVNELIHPAGRKSYAAGIEHALKYGRSETIETSIISHDGSSVPLEGSLTCSYRDGRPAAVWWICRDITDRKLAQQQLYQLAHYDTLTGLPNRMLLYDRLRQARAYAHREGLSMAILFLDLDRFKIINDTLGHPVGDKLLQSVARRLSSCVREVDTAARIGGDEFLIILVNMRDTGDAERVAVKILATLATPHVIEEHELFVTTSIGISVYPSDEEDLDDLIKKADIAMYAAKSVGSNTYQFYDPAMDENAHKRFVLENSLRKAVENKEFLVYYQPKVDIVSGEITAFEALLRWEHPDLGLLSPAEFIPLAEETGLIIPVGEWVLREACAQNAAWQQQGLSQMVVAVNLSGYQLQQRNFIEVVTEILAETGLSANHLEFEITETVIMQNPDFTISVLNKLRDMGVQISIDDFGTGYSSLSHLKRFSVNTLKIDKTFVREVESNSTDAAIATAIIAMGNSLNLRVIAEGVETKGQFDFLRDKLCDEMQGFYFSRPMPPEKVLEFMQGKTVKGTDREVSPE